ncbi:MAG: T9SS type A sorting domain-containing protein, partial [Ignavibacteriaceae bacterium]
MKYLLFLISGLILLPIGFNPNSFAQEDIRITAYNVLEYKPNIGSRKNAIINVIDNISPDPDIFVGVEINDNLTAAEDFRINVLNHLVTDKYFLGTSPIPTAAYGLQGGANVGQFSNFLYYKPDKFTYLNGSIVVDDGKWPTLKFELYHNQTGNKIIIFGVHLTSGDNQTQREYEANAIRTVTDSYSNGENFIAAGDFNFVYGTEGAYTVLIGPGSGQFYDTGGFLPIYNTFQSNLLYSRYDLTLVSGTVASMGGVYYKAGSFVADGNTGSSSAGSPYDDASDHLPVYADFTFDFPSPVNPPYPGSIAFTQVGSSGNGVIEFITLYRTNLTTLKITDNGIDQNGALTSGEGTYDLSNTPWTDVPAGTFVRLGSLLSNDDDASDRFLAYNGNGSGNLPNLETGGEQLIAYTGSSPNPDYYIAGINWGNSGWSITTSTHTSYEPGTPSDIELGVSNDYTFTGTVDGSLYATRNALINSSNWGNAPSPGNYENLNANIGSGALPVELISFNASFNKDNIDLHWETQTEVNNYGFNVERSVDNKNWGNLGFVEGNGNSNSPKYYDFIDKDITNSGIYKYRLKQIDNDGTFEYSKIVNVNVSLPENYYLSQNYPNPFNPETRIDFSIPQKQMVTLRIYNTIGEQVAELLNGEKDAGSYTVTFNGSNLPSGIYIYRLTTQNFVM